MDEIDRSRRLVVILDDEPGIIRYCGRVLERAGYTTLAFTNPYEALGVLEQREEAGLLLADIRMPEMDGFQVIEQARQRHPDLAVVVMTGYASVEVAIEALQRGADGLLLKPFGGSQLVQGVQHALEQRQHKQDQMRLQALRPLFDISETLFSETNLKRLQGLILNTICGHLRCSHAEYYQASAGESAEKPGRMRLVGGLHYPGGKARVERRPSSSLSNEPIVRRASQAGTVLSIQVDGPGDPELKEMLRQRKLGCMLCAPVPAKTGGGVGEMSASMLVAGRDEDEPRFGEADRELLAILARQAAVALENARLIEERQAYIRQLEQSQRALIQAEKMAIAGRLTASIAHEINNPLQAVQNCVHLAGRGELPTAERQNYLELAGGELERLMATVQRMLDFYRPVRLDRKPVEINQLVRNLMRLLDKQLADERVSVKTNLALNLPAVMAVGDQIQQVLLNLMLNAMEAMKDGNAGDAAAEAGRAGRRLEIQTGINPSNGKEIEILIEDNGPGISALQRKQLFEPFASNKEGGMGLGLAVSYGIITAHGGSLDLVERSGGSKQGACFRITLPIDKEQES
jgi:signal transduction histidine kinase/CheY-like chemotaxis protein